MFNQIQNVMRKILLMILAVSVISCAFAQNKNFAKDLTKMKSRSLEQKMDVTDLPFLPLKPVPAVSSAKAVSLIPIGTSANIYTVLHDGGRWLSYNPEVNAISFIHRQGGTWGGTSGNLKQTFSTDYFTTHDSASYTATSPNLFRYPGGVIYNATQGNTDPNQAYGIFVGPCTNGSGWISNYFGTSKLDGTGGNVIYDTQPADTNLLPQTNLTGGSGFFYTMANVYPAGGNEILRYQIDKITFNSNNNQVELNKMNLVPLVKKRTFSNATVNWAGNSDLAFENNGTTGFFYLMGADSLVDPYHTSIPLLWKTFDGGNTWSQLPVYGNWDKIGSIRHYIYPTRASLGIADTNLWVYRPDFPSGAAGNEGNFPGTIDINGNLHIATLVEGRFSAHPDSLEYSYAAHPFFLFDVYQTQTGWEAIFVDTIKTYPVEAANSGFGTGTDALGWDHWIKISKNATGSKIFISWVDTDPLIDTTNIMPEVSSWGVDVVSKMMTESKSFATGDGATYYFATSDITVYEGTLNKIPASCVNIYESGPDPVSAQKHYFMSGIEFDDAEFNIPVPQYQNPDVVKNTARLNVNTGVSDIYPNPANATAKLNVTLNESADINISVTNLLGQTIYQAAKTNAGSGIHTFSMDTKTWGNGVYFYTVTFGGNKVTKKLIVE